jgi:hypothetical protein
MPLSRVHPPTCLTVVGAQTQMQRERGALRLLRYEAANADGGAF